MEPQSVRFSALHVDVARFRDRRFQSVSRSQQVQRIEGNPFGGTIVLGFQLSSFALHGVSMLHAAAPLRQRYLHVRVTFADAVRVDDEVELTIRPAQQRCRWRHCQSPHRAAYGAQPRPDGSYPLRAGRAGDPPAPVPPSRLNGIRDRTDVPGTAYFLKRKFMSTANAKNFLLGANVDPAIYFDELEDRVRFTELFPVSLVSCALLERGTRHGHDFLQAPMVYSYHDIVVDRMSPCACAATIRSTCWFRPAIRRAVQPPPACAASSVCICASATRVPVSACSAPKSASSRWSRSPPRRARHHPIAGGAAARARSGADEPGRPC